MRWMTGLKEEEDVTDLLQMRCIKPVDAVKAPRLKVSEKMAGWR